MSTLFAGWEVHTIIGTITAEIKVHTKVHNFANFINLDSNFDIPTAEKRLMNVRYFYLFSTNFFTYLTLNASDGIVETREPNGHNFTRRLG